MFYDAIAKGLHECYTTAEIERILNELPTGCVVARNVVCRQVPVFRQGGTVLLILRQCSLHFEEDAVTGDMKDMNRALLSSKKMDYCTPQDFFDVLNGEFHFVLDAAATEESAKCPAYYTPETDGLSSPWNIAGGAVCCNPPYGRESGKWVQKAYQEAKNGTTIVLLIPARTDTSYFHDYIYGKAEIRFVRGRLHFTDEDGRKYPPAPFPSMVVVYNKEREAQI